MSTTLKRLKPLPTISQVDRADDHLGLLLSDLDWMTSDVASFSDSTERMDDAVFLSRHGIADDPEHRYVEPATIARLLVFADELEGDAEALREYAVRLRGSLLWIYRQHIFEPSGRRRMRGDDGEH
jgi:hypothetical protein